MAFPASIYQGSFLHGDLLDGKGGGGYDLDEVTDEVRGIEQYLGGIGDSNRTEHLNFHIIAPVATTDHIKGITFPNYGIVVTNAFVNAGSAPGNTCFFIVGSGTGGAGFGVVLASASVTGSGAGAVKVGSTQQLCIYCATQNAQPMQNVNITLRFYKGSIPV